MSPKPSPSRSPTASAVVLSGQGRDHHNGDEVRFPVQLESFAEGIAIGVRQKEVEEDDIGLILPDPSDGVFAFVEDMRFVAPSAQMFAEKLAEFDFILDD